MPKGRFGSVPAVQLRSNEWLLLAPSVSAARLALRQLSGASGKHMLVASLSQAGATRTFCNVRYPFAMGWQADLEEAVRNKLNL